MISLTVANRFSYYFLGHRVKFISRKTAKFAPRLAELEIRQNDAN
jgi:hypothetical protein